MTQDPCTSCRDRHADRESTRSASLAAGASMSRRTVLRGSAAVVAGLVLAACSSPADTATTPTPDPTTPTPPPGGSASATETADAPEGEQLTSASGVAVGGGVIVAASVGTVVVTQPSAGEFKAFNGKCPHQGYPVSSVAGNTITCNHHGSTFDAATGDRTGGPAPTGLTPLDISVEGDAVYLT